MKKNNLVSVVAAVVVAAGLAGCGSGRGGHSSTEQQSSSPAADGAMTAGAHSSRLSAGDFRPGLFTDSSRVDNRWYPLVPGARLTYEGSALDGGKRIQHGVVTIVTDLTKVVAGVRNVVVWERDFEAGRLVEAELALFAQDRYGNVWHTGEYPEEYENGKIVKTPAWVHGVNGATAGITVPGQPRTGTPSFAEGFAPPPVSWADRGKVYRTGTSTCVPTGCYHDVVVIAEFERSVPDAFQDKYFAPGVGVVRVGWRGARDDSKEVLKLVSAATLDGSQLARARRAALAMEDRAVHLSKDVWGTTARVQRLPQ